MHFLVRFLLAGFAGAALGLLATFLALQRGAAFGSIEAGPWTASPKNGTLDIDPYARAGLAYRGELPLGAAEGISFVAHRDSAGAPFNARCDYTLSGETPRARYWTLTLLTPAGFPAANDARRYGFTSSELLRGADGGFEITLSRNARPGNWLPIGEDSKFVPVLRLYDTDAAALALDATNLPRLVKSACR